MFAWLQTSGPLVCIQRLAAARGRTCFELELRFRDGLFCGRRLSWLLMDKQAPPSAARVVCRGGGTQCGRCAPATAVRGTEGHLLVEQRLLLALCVVAIILEPSECIPFAGLGEVHGRRAES